MVKLNSRSKYELEDSWATQTWASVSIRITEK